MEEKKRKFTALQIKIWNSTLLCITSINVKILVAKMMECVPIEPFKTTIIMAMMMESGPRTFSVIVPNMRPGKNVKKFQSVNWSVKMGANATFEVIMATHVFVRLISGESSVSLNALWTVRMEGNALLRRWALLLLPNKLSNKSVDVAFPMKEISAKRSASVNSVVKMEAAACFQSLGWRKKNSLSYALKTIVRRIFFNPLRIVSAHRNGRESSAPSLVRVKMEAPAFLRGAGSGIENLTRTQITRQRNFGMMMTTATIPTIATALLGIMAATVSLNYPTESALWSVKMVDTALQEKNGLLMLKKEEEMNGLLMSIVMESTNFAPVKQDTAEVTAKSRRTAAPSLVRMVVSVLVMKLAYRVDTIECWRTKRMLMMTTAAAKKDSLVIFVNERNVGRGFVRMAPRVFSCYLVKQLLVEGTMYVTAPLLPLMIFILLDVTANPLQEISAILARKIPMSHGFVQILDGAS
jgi:hypothetical protein